MPRGRKRSPVENRNWLARHETGDPIEQIAKEARRAPSTVWKGIQAGRAERDTQDVRSGLLKEAYSSHFDDLHGLLQVLEEQSHELESMALRFDDDKRLELLLQGLKEHIPDFPLWRAVGDWQAAVERIEGAKAEMEERVTEMVRGAVPNEASHYLTAGFIASLVLAGTAAAHGESTDEFEYRKEQSSEGLSLHWGAFKLSVDVPADSAFDEIRNKHVGMVQQVRQQDTVSEMAEGLQRWNDARKRVATEVETLLLRRFIPGKCRFCPG